MKTKILKLLWNYLVFIVISGVVVIAFVTATTYLQLAAAIILYPLVIWYAYKLLPSSFKYSRSQKLTSKSEASHVVAPVETLKSEPPGSFGISDADKRVFLKLIGGAGLMLFLFSLFNKRAEGAFFKSLPGGAVSGKVALEDTKGNQIDPAQNQPLDGYGISEIDDGNISFYGFTSKTGAWYVMRVDSQTGSFRYTRGENNFPSNWTNRQNLNYDYFSTVF